MVPAGKAGDLQLLNQRYLFAIFIGWPIDEFGSVKADIEGQFMQVVDQIPQFAERVRAGRREERFYGAADLPNFLRRPAGPGWALVGDAGSHKDPMMAHVAMPFVTLISCPRRFTKAWLGSALWTTL